MMATLDTETTAHHWDRAYSHGDTTRSWYQQLPQPSLHMLDAIGATPRDSLIDVGGGASPLVDALLDRGYTDVTVLDISRTALSTAQRRLGADAGRADWLVADLLTWQSTRRWDIWHDRATLHFFTNDADRMTYLNLLDQAVSATGFAILATFAPDGPQVCSGLPVGRYDSQKLARLLGHRWELVIHTREEHGTPGGASQPFTWTAFHRRSSDRGE
jgi:hypothetical protein